VPFTSVHAGKYVTEDKSTTDTTKTKDKPEKANNTKYSKIKLDWFSRLLRHRPGNEVGLFYNAPELIYHGVTLLILLLISINMYNVTYCKAYLMT